MARKPALRLDRLLLLAVDTRAHYARIFPKSRPDVHCHVKRSLYISHTARLSGVLFLYLISAPGPLRAARVHRVPYVDGWWPRLSWASRRRPLGANYARVGADIRFPCGLAPSIVGATGVRNESVTERQAHRSSDREQLRGSRALVSNVAAARPPRRGRA